MRFAIPWQEDLPRIVLETAGLVAPKPRTRPMSGIQERPDQFLRQLHRPNAQVDAHNCQWLQRDTPGGRAFFAAASAMAMACSHRRRYPRMADRALLGRLEP